MTPVSQAHRRLRHLYEISTLLTRFGGVERTVPEVVDVAARALPVRTAVLVLDASDALHSHVWKTDDVDDIASKRVLDRARSEYAWFSGRARIPEERAAPPPSMRGLPARSALPGTDARFVVSPLVVERGRVFGVLQFEGAAPLDEGDLFFVNAAANQLAVAIDRQASIDDAEARVRSQLDFTRTLTTSLGEGVVATDIDARITFLNPAAEELLGWKEASVLGALAPDVLRVRAADGAMLEHGECPLVRAIESQTRIVCDDHSFLGREGVAVPVSYTAAPLRSAGRICGAVLVVRDVLAVKRSERTQRLLASVSAALGESLDYAATLATLPRCVIPSFADVCFIEEVEGGRAVAPGIVEQVAEEAPGDGGHDGDGDQSGGARRASGVRPRVRSSIAVPLAVRGSAFGVVTFGMGESGRRYTAHDLPLAEELGHRAAIAIDSARLHRATEDALRSRQDILAVVSHDLRTPLSNVTMAAATLLRRQGGPDRGADDRPIVEVIERAARRMDRMIEDLLDLSSVEAGHLAIDAKPTPVATIISDILEAMAQSAAASSLQLVAGAADPLLLVRCDRDRILQVLTNLVGNAIKFTPPGGRVAISTESSAGFVRFLVADTGPGIAAELLPHVFERYRQAAATAFKGRGLGLYIAKGIVEAHGCSIGVDTELGRGTTFVFSLPRAAATLANTRDPKHRAPIEASAQRTALQSKRSR